MSPGFEVMWVKPSNARSQFRSRKKKKNPPKKNKKKNVTPGRVYMYENKRNITKLR